jgi:hypothetical protein
MKETNVLCIILVISITLVQGQSKTTLDIINSARSLISMSIDIGNRLAGKKDDNLHHKLDELESAINNMKKSMAIEFSNFKDFIKEEIFYNYIRGLIDEVNSCLKEYEHLKANLNDPGMKANFWNQCKNIITPLRALGKTLSTATVKGEHTLMANSLDMEVTCNAVIINGVFSSIFHHLAEGCAAFSMAQTYKHGSTSGIYEAEFRKMFDHIRTQYTAVYQNCSIQICSRDFLVKVKEIIKIRKTLNETLLQLHQQLPYLEFFILKLKPNASCLQVPVNHELTYLNVPHSKALYRVYAVKSDKLANGKSHIYKLIEYHPSYFLDYGLGNMTIDKICEEGMSTCAFKIYVNGEDANCFHSDFGECNNYATSSLFSFGLCVLLGWCMARCN